jgi:hypothetical protein
MTMMMKREQYKNKEWIRYRRREKTHAREKVKVEDHEDKE